MLNKINFSLITVCFDLSFIYLPDRARVSSSVSLSKEKEERGRECVLGEGAKRDPAELYGQTESTGIFAPLWLCFHAKTFKEKIKKETFARKTSVHGQRSLQRCSASLWPHQFGFNNGIQI